MKSCSLWTISIVLAACSCLGPELCGQNQSGNVQYEPAVNPQQLENLNQAAGFFANQPISHVTFISFDPIDDESRQAVQEDVRILQHLINKAMPPARNRQALGVTLTTQVASNDETIYVGGKGLILIRHVSMPVAPLEEQPVASQAEPENQLSKWERAKLELHDQRANRFLAGNLNRLDGALGGNVSANMRYEPAYASGVGNAIREALGNAGNFRMLDPQDTITVFIVGPGRHHKERTVLAFEANPSDGSDDGQIAESSIRDRQYRETTGR